VTATDIIELDLGQDVAWKRTGFLDKIFTPEEQAIILHYEIPESMIWILWSMKEAAFKAFNRQYSIRAYIPLLLRCETIEVGEKTILGKVTYEEAVFFTQTIVTDNSIETVAVQNADDFSRVRIIDSFAQINKAKGLPDFYDPESNEFRPVSINHHGRFRRTFFT
jgi:phosphopantetheinyl transferase (holo-ACP synthase)